MLEKFSEEGEKMDKKKVVIVNCYGNFTPGNKEYKKYLENCVKTISKIDNLKKIILAGGFTKDPNISEALSVYSPIKNMLNQNNIFEPVEIQEESLNASGNLYFSIKKESDLKDTSLIWISDHVHFWKNLIISGWVRVLFFPKNKISNISCARDDKHPLHKNILQNIQAFFYLFLGYLLIPLDIWGADLKQLIREMLVGDVVSKIFIYSLLRLLYLFDK